MLSSADSSESMSCFRAKAGPLFPIETPPSDSESDSESSACFNFFGDTALLLLLALAVVGLFALSTFAFLPPEICVAFVGDVFRLVPAYAAFVFVVVDIFSSEKL